MDDHKFPRGVDTALLTFSVLKRLGTGRVASFDDRLRSQKVQYLAQLFKVSPEYPFGLYLRGPYSSQLADDLYRIQREGLDVREQPFTIDELEDRLRQLSSFLKGKDNRQLEVLVTLHWLLKIANLDLRDAKSKLIELKHATPYEIDNSLAALKYLP